MVSGVGGDVPVVVDAPRRPADLDRLGSVAGPEAEVRRVFYLLYEVQKYIVIRRARSGDPRRADAYRRQASQLARALG